MDSIIVVVAAARSRTLSECDARLETCSRVRELRLHCLCKHTMNLKLA